MRGGNCATCENWQPKKHEGWEPDYPGDYYDIADLRLHLSSRGRTLAAWPGICQLMPEWRDVTAQHGCAAHAIKSRYFVMSWSEYESQFEMAKECQEMRAEIKRLRAKLREERIKAKERDEA